MTSPELSIHHDGNVAVLEIHRPPTNYFDRDILAEIADAAEELQQRSTVRALVLCSEGKHFCAGANFAPGGLGSDRMSASRALYQEAVRLFDIELPIVAAVQGSAVGGGLGLALAADFRVASESTTFTANFSRLGFHQGFALTVTLPRVVGAQRAAEMLYTSSRIAGKEAVRIGLADRLVDVGGERAGALAFAKEIASSAPLAVRAIKKTLRAGLAQEVREILPHELSQQEWLWATEDSRRGIEASINRTEPEFTGR